MVRTHTRSARQLLAAAKQLLTTGTTSKLAYFLISKFGIEVDVNLDPEKLSWVAEGRILVTGTASFVLPGSKYQSQPYEFEISEDGRVSKCECSDPMHQQLIAMAAKNSKRELVELIRDEKERGSLRKKP